MSFLNNMRSEKIEHWSPVSFYIAGGLLLLFALNLVAHFFGLGSTLTTYINLSAISDIIAITGLFVLYPKLSPKTPRISLSAVLFLAIALVCSFWNQTVMLGNNLFELPDFFISDTFIWTNFISLLVGYLLFGIAILLTNKFPKMFGFAVLTTAALTFLVVIFYLLRGIGNITTWFTLIIVSSQALVYLAMGYILKNKDKIANTKNAAV